LARGQDSLREQSPSATPADDLHLTDLEVRPTDHQVPVSGAESSAPSSAERGGEDVVARAEDAKHTPEPRSADDDSGVTSFRPDVWDDELLALQLELSSTVAQPMKSWDLASVRTKTEQLIEEGDSALQRGRARLLLDQISQFEDLQRGKTPAAAETQVLASPNALYVPPAQNAVSQTAVSGPASSGVPAESGSNSQGAALLEQLAAEGRYDGVGWLLPVHSQNRIAPRFALTDERGRVIQYIVPAPGRNLHRHLRKQVGIIGQRQSLTGLSAPVLTASNVIELDRHR
jgi:hypothetical protein